jgi:hypothetical protein
MNTTGVARASARTSESVRPPSGPVPFGPVNLRRAVSPVDERAVGARKRFETAVNLLERFVDTRGVLRGVRGERDL